MRFAKDFLKVLAEIFAILVFIVLAGLILQNLLSITQLATSSATQPVENQRDSVYPPVEATPYPIPPTEPFVYPSPTIRHTWTPYPTNTANPRTMSTAIPIPKPANNSAGKIIFVAMDEKGEKVIKALDVDEAGHAEQNDTMVLASQMPEGTYYLSPDGEKFVIISGTESGITGSLFDVESGKLTSLFDGLPITAFFNWYPDSQQVLVSLLDYGLWLINIENPREAIPLNRPNPGRIVAAASSPDGRRIIYTFCKGSDGPAQIWLVNPDGRDALDVMETPYIPYNLSWSPDGSQIAFIGDGIMVMNPDGSNLRQLGRYPLLHCYPFNSFWSPDSQKLAIPVVSTQPGAFCQGWGQENLNGTNFAVIDVNTGQNFLLPVDKTTGNIDPSWSPDGKKLVFISNRDGTPDLWAMDVYQGNPYPLTSDGQFVRYPIWLRP